MTPEERKDDSLRLKELSEWTGTLTEVDCAFLRSVAAHHARMVPWEAVGPLLTQITDTFTGSYSFQIMSLIAEVRKWRPTNET